jgi:Spy/CpxP family protein refolding chaperone
MSILRLVAGLALSIAVAAPGAVFAAQSATMYAQASSMSPAQVQAAVKSALQSVNLTPRQKLQIKPMVEEYQSQTAGADAATKKSAQEALIKKIYGILTPDQQTKFKASLKASMGAAASH